MVTRGEWKYSEDEANTKLRGNKETKGSTGHRGYNEEKGSEERSARGDVMRVRGERTCKEGK